MRILAVGDIGIHGRIATLAHRNAEGLIGATRPLMAGADVVLGNLEVPIAPPGFSGKVPATGLAPPESAALLRRWGFTHLSLANNHVMDAGEGGLATTLRLLREAGITPFGAGLTLDEARAPILIDGEPPVALLGYSMLCPANATNSRGGSAPLRLREAREEVRRLRAGGRRVVVSLHVGRMYLRRPSPSQLRLTHQLLDAGASLVLCHHAHVPAGVLQRDGGAAALGLGDFVWDPLQGEIRTLVGRRSRLDSMILAADLGASSCRIERTPVIGSTEGPRPHPSAQRVLRRWSRWDRELRLPPRLYALLYYGIEFPRLIAYLAHAAAIFASRGEWGKARAATFGVLSSKLGGGGGPSRPDAGRGHDHEPAQN